MIAAFGRSITTLIIISGALVVLRLADCIAWPWLVVFLPLIVLGCVWLTALLIFRLARAFDCRLAD